MVDILLMILLECLLYITLSSDPIWGWLLWYIEHILVFLRYNSLGCAENDKRTIGERTRLIWGTVVGFLSIIRWDRSPINNVNL